MMLNKKDDIKDQLENLLDNKIVKGALVVVASVATLYLVSKVFILVGKTVTSFKNMRDSFRS